MNLKEIANSYLVELHTQENENFEKWCLEMISYINNDTNDSINLQTTGRLMIFEQERGILNISYSDRLGIFF